MQSYLKTRPVWIQLLLFLGMAFGIFMALTLVGVLVLSNITGISLMEISDLENWDSSNPNMIVFIRGMLLLQFLGLFLIPSLLFAYFSDPEPLPYIGLKPPGKRIYWLFGIVIMLIAVPLVEYLGILNRQMVFGAGTQRWMQSMEEDAMKQIQFMLSKHTPTELVLNLIFIALFAGIGEELFFRGILQRLFIKGLRNVWAGIILTAILFSAFHLQFFGFLPRLVLGIILGMLYWYSGSIWPAILAHFVYDAFIIVLVYLNPALAADAEASIFEQSKLSIMALGSAAIVGVMAWQMVRQSRTEYVQVYKNDTMPPQDFTF